MTSLPLALPPELADQCTVAERKWQARTVAGKPQRPCDHGMFSDDHNQIEMPMT